MKKINGFTLVEIAIVLTIVGLLIGGVLKGQQLMQNARIAATLAQVKAYEAAMETFKDTYNALPGDMPDADVKIPNCGNCRPIPAGLGGAAGDSYIGIGPVLGGGYTFAGGQAFLNNNSNPAPDLRLESILFWAELAQAGLITGVTNDGITNTNPPTFGTSLPAARIGGGFVVGYAANNGVTFQPSYGRPAGSPSVAMTGTAAALYPSYRAHPPAGPGGRPGQEPLTPSEAFRMDFKTDDGQPESGFTQAVGVTTSCYTSAAGPPYAYNETVNSKDCGLIFRIGG